jgi:hypothetical protein
MLSKLSGSRRTSPSTTDTNNASSRYGGLWCQTASPTVGNRRAEVCESADAKSVTSWPRRTSSSVNVWITRSQTVAPSERCAREPNLLSLADSDAQVSERRGCAFGQVHTACIDYRGTALSSWYSFAGGTSVPALCAPYVLALPEARKGSRAQGQRSRSSRRIDQFLEQTRPQ